MADNITLELQAESTKQAYARYSKLYEDSRKGAPHSESLLLSILAKQSETLAATTLWTMYSLVKKYLLLECQFDIGRSERITNFLRTISRFHKKKQAPAFTRDQLFEYLKTAPNVGYPLINKLVLLVGYYAGLRSSETVALTWEDLEFAVEGILVKIVCSKTDRAAIGAFKLLPKLDDQELCPVRYFLLYKTMVKSATGRLFCQFRNDSFTRMPIGKTSIAVVPKQIALFLRLDGARLYTGHALRVSSATILADEGADVLTLKRHGRWTSDSIAEGYVRDSKHSRMEAASLLAGPSNISISNNGDEKARSTQHNAIFSNCVFNGTVNFVKEK